MANDIKNGQAITNEALDELHQAMTFTQSTNLQYDDRFKVNGAKGGATLQIRLPSQYSVRSGRTLNVQDNEEQKVDLTYAYQKGVDVEFTSEEMALKMDDFRERVLAPQMKVLASVIEAHYLQTVTKEVNQLVDDDGVAIDFDTILTAREVLTNALAPDDEQRTCLLSPRHMRKLVDSNKTLFHDPKQITHQYSKGVMGHAVGFDFAESTHVLDHTTGTAVKTTLYTVNGATQNGSSITIQTGATTFKAGDIVTFAGANRCHPETKADTGVLMQFVVTEDTSTSATTLKISPPLIPIAVNAAKANVTAYPTDTGAVVKVGAAASEKLNGSLAYHKNAFAFVSADLKLPTNNAVEAYRATFEGLSLRLIQGYDIVNDTFPSRWDILYGFKCIRPELAVRIHADG
jgi:hypothetical protein